MGRSCLAATLVSDSNSPSVGHHLDQRYRKQEKQVHRKDRLSTGKFAAAGISLYETFRLHRPHSQGSRASSNTSVSTFSQRGDAVE